MHEVNPKINELILFRSEDGNLDFEEFSTLINSLSSTAEPDRDKKLFALLDRDEDDLIEFDDILVFIYSMEVDMAAEEKRIRSFRFYDR